MFFVLAFDQSLGLSWRLMIAMVYQDLIIKMDLINQFMRFEYGFKPEHFTSQLIQKLLEMNEVMRNYNQIESTYENIRILLYFL